MIIKAQSPAGFAEEYIIESIWNNRFAPGTILPAERELSELIGVTRTTLREVLQRLARDGWLTIQHGKPTRVNNVWETSGLNILETLARLDQEKFPQLLDHLLSARTNISGIFIRGAVKNNPEQVITLTAEAANLGDDAASFSDFDYRLYHQLAFASGNPIYALILNGFHGLYTRLGHIYFAEKQTRDCSLNFYRQLSELAARGEYEAVLPLVRQYGADSGKLWHTLKASMSDNLVEI